MQIINDLFHDCRFNQSIENFLQQLLNKAQKSYPSSTIIDDLYGLIPPLEVTLFQADCIDAETQNLIRQWNLSGILMVKSQWDEFLTEIMWTGNAFFVKRLQICQYEMIFELKTPFNLEVYGNLRYHTERRLQLLALSYENSLMRLIGIKERLRELLTRLSSQDSYPACLEILITLLNAPLSPEEKVNMDLFCERARITLAACIGYRGALASKDFQNQTFFSCAAARKSHLLYEELHSAIILVWGCLANAEFMEKERYGKGRFYFTESYFPDGRIQIGEILPALPGDITEMQPLNGCDFYKQVFPNYDTAAYFRTAALRLANQ